MNVIQNIIQSLNQFFAASWEQLIWIFLLYLLSKFLLGRGIKKFVLLVNGGRKADPEKKEKRANTLRGILVALGNTIIYAVILFMLLDLFGVDTKPFLTGAGVIGLAIGFGSQALVRDFMSGVFVLLEGQYSVGDRIKIGNFEGTVKRITMRSTVLEGQDGERMYISNGSVSSVINFSQKVK